METITIRTKNANQLNLFVSLAKEMKIDYTTGDSKGNTFLKKLNRAGKDAMKIASGEMKGETFDSLFEKK